MHLTTMCRAAAAVTMLCTIGALPADEMPPRPFSGLDWRQDLVLDTDKIRAVLGYEEPVGNVTWAGFDAGPFGFAFRRVGSPLEYGLTISGSTVRIGSCIAAAASAPLPYAAMRSFMRLR